MGKLPLAGIRVLDLTIVYAGPTCTRILAELGAQVIKIEHPRYPEGPRLSLPADNDPGVEPWNRGGYFIERNLGKLSLTLDLDHPLGKEVFKRLVAMSDVVAESFSPRVMRNLGLDYPTLRRVKGDIIMISLSGYGQTGPWQHYVAFGGGLEAASGIAFGTGYAGGPPLRTSIAYTDPIAGTAGASAVLLALYHRRRTGQGQYIDLAEREVAIPFVGEMIMDHAMNRRSPQRQGNRHSFMAPHGCYRCRGDDAWVAIAIATDEEWRRLRQTMGDPPWSHQAQFASMSSRWHHREELDGYIEAWTREQDPMEVAQQLQEAEVAAGAVLKGKDIVLNPHLQGSAFFRKTVLPADVGQRSFAPSLAARFDGVLPPLAGPAPRFGEHNEIVLMGLLELDSPAMDELRREGVISNAPQLSLPVGHTPTVLDLALLERLGLVADGDAD